MRRILKKSMVAILLIVLSAPLFASKVTIYIKKPLSDGGSKVLGYIIEKKNLGAEEWVRLVKDILPLPGNNPMYTVILDPGIYDFRVMAVTKVGTSAPSEPGRARVPYNNSESEVRLVCNDCPPISGKSISKAFSTPFDFLKFNNKSEV